MHSPVVLVGGRWRMEQAASPMISGLRPFAIRSGPPTSNSMAAVDTRVRGQRAFTATGILRNSSAMPMVSMDMPYLLTV